jgi:hypothetical protein
MATTYKSSLELRNYGDELRAAAFDQSFCEMRWTGTLFPGTEFSMQQLEREIDFNLILRQL